MKIPVLSCLAAVLGVSEAFVQPACVSARDNMVMNAEPTDRRGFIKAAGALVAPLLIGAQAASAKIDYEGVGFLGGSDKIDINNANIRAYLKLPGMYPTVAGKIVSHGPYKGPSDLYNIPGLSGAEKDVIKKYEAKFIALEPSVEYTIDRINNGLYR